MSSMVQYKSADYTGALAKGLEAGSRFGGAIKQGIAEAGYSNAKDAATKTRDEALKAAGNDQKAIDLANQNYSKAMDSAYESYAIGMGDIKGANDARLKGEQRSFRDNFFGELKKNSAAYDQKIVDDLNTDTMTKVNGITYSLGDKPNMLLMTQNGQTQSIPFTDEQRMPYVNNLYDTEFKNKFGTNPTEPASEASSGAQATTAQAQAMPSKVAQSSNPRVVQADPLVAEVAASDPRTKPQAIPQKSEQASGTSQDSLSHMEQQERQLYDYAIAYYKRFGELPPGLDGNRLLAVTNAQETGRKNRATEDYQNRSLTETSRHNLESERLTEESNRIRERANDIREAWYTGKLTGVGKDSGETSTTDLGEPNEDGSLPVIDKKTKLPTGVCLRKLRVGNTDVTVYPPDGTSEAQAAKVYKAMTEKYGNPKNIGSNTYWITGDKTRCSFSEAFKLITKGAPQISTPKKSETPKKTETPASTASNKGGASGKKDDKKGDKPGSNKSDKLNKKITKDRPTAVQRWWRQSEENTRRLAERNKKLYTNKDGTRKQMKSSDIVPSRAMRAFGSDKED